MGNVAVYSGGAECGAECGAVDASWAEIRPLLATCHDLHESIKITMLKAGDDALTDGKR
jgi:hypothetical protein